MNAFIRLGGALGSFAAIAFAQVPDAPAPAPTAPGAPAPATPAIPAASAPGGAAPASTAPGATPNSTFLGKDVPSLDPGTDILTWDGKNWNINNNRLFGARFEKYLNAPAATTKEDREYQAIIAAVLTRIAQKNASRDDITY